MVWASLPILSGFYPKWVSPPILQLCSCRLYDLPVLPKVLMFDTIKAAAEMVVSGSSDFIGFGVQAAPVALMLSGFWGAISSPKMQLPTLRQLHPH